MIVVKLVTIDSSVNLVNVLFFCFFVICLFVFVLTSFIRAVI